MAKKEEVKTRASIIYAGSVSHETSEVYFGHPENVGIYDGAIVRAVYPIDAHTGLPMTDIGRLTSPHLTDAEKERIMQRLKPERGTYISNKLTDKDIMELVPPRYFQDAVDVQMWRDYLAKDIFPQLEAEDRKQAEELTDVDKVVNPVEVEDEE